MPWGITGSLVHRTKYDNTETNHLTLVSCESVTSHQSSLPNTNKLYNDIIVTLPSSKAAMLRKWNIDSASIHSHHFPSLCLASARSVFFPHYVFILFHISPFGYRGTGFGDRRGLKWGIIKFFPLHPLRLYLWGRLRVQNMFFQRFCNEPNYWGTRYFFRLHLF